MNTTASTFELGTSTVACGQKGPWTLETFDVSPREAQLHNLSTLQPGRSLWRIHAGRFKRLMHAEREVVMSNTPMEVASNRQAYRHATGQVLINGLGMGMLLEAVLSKPDVTLVRVIEVDADLIALVGPHFENDPRVEIIHADAFAYQPAKGEVFDFVWHDIWDDICADNLEAMKRLTRKYRKPRAKAQACWSKDMILAMGRRF